MVFPVVGGDGKPTGYEIDNSLRFNSSDTARLGKTISGTSNRKTFSMSFWLKKTKISGYGGIFGVGTASSDTGKLQIRIDGSDNLKIEGGSTTYRVTDREFRDVSAWYNIFISFDSTQSTAGNRILIYVNGVQETSFSTSNNPSQDANTPFNEDGKTHYIGTEGDGSSAALDGYLAEFHYIDGTKKAYTDFGEFDDNGVWIPKEYDGSYGTHGFYFQFKQTGTSANSSGMGADTSGNDNHYTPNNLAATDVTVDTPTNNFATLNPLSAKTLTFSEGNLHATNDSAAGSATGTIAPTNGKWYFEITLSGSANFAAGVVNLDDWQSGTDIYSYGQAAAVLIESNANYNVTYGNTASSPSTLQTGTQLLNATYGFAMDIDNNDLYVSANGNWYTGSAFDNTSFSSASAVTTDLPSNVPLTAFIRNPDSGTAQCNFGNPAISISSGNADANGYGNFEYAVPSGYYSLNTKNLAEFG